MVCRSFPIASLTKEKKLSAQYMTHLEQWLQESLQIRSTTFQVLAIFQVSNTPWYPSPSKYLPPTRYLPPSTYM